MSDWPTTVELGPHYPITPLATATAASPTQTATANTFYWVEFRLPGRMLVTGLGYYVSSAVGNVKAGLYDSRGVSWSGTAPKLAETTATVAVGTAFATQHVAFASAILLEPGQYVAGFVFSGAAIFYKIDAALNARTGSVAVGAFNAPATSVTMPAATVPLGAAGTQPNMWAYT